MSADNTELPGSNAREEGTAPSSRPLASPRREASLLKLDRDGRQRSDGRPGHFSGNTDWDSAKISTLISLWNEGHSTGEIARRMRVSKNAVIGKAHRLGLSKRNSPIKRTSGPPKPLGLADLEPGECRWPEGDPKEDGFRFCGKPAVPSKPYCSDHCARAHERKAISPDDKRHLNRPDTTKFFFGNGEDAA